MMKHLLLFLMFALFAGFSSATSSSNTKVTESQTTTSITSSTTTSPPPLPRILQSSAPRVVAEAYECDENEERIAADVIFPKRVGAEIRVCIAPNTPTRYRGVFIRSIQDFTFFKNGGTASQVVIADGVESDARLTLLLCIPGAEICSFKTTLEPELFFGGTDGNITGTGQVAMQEGHLDRRQRRQLLTADTTDAPLLRGTIQWRGGRQAQVADVADNFAGLSNVKMEFSFKKATKQEQADALGKQTESWWASKPPLLRIFIMVIIISTILGCCCCGLSWEYVIEMVIAQQRSFIEQRKSIAEEPVYELGKQEEKKRNSVFEMESVAEKHVFI
jgi:hypothetical protein